MFVRSKMFRLSDVAVLLPLASIHGDMLPVNLKATHHMHQHYPSRCVRCLASVNCALNQCGQEESFQGLGAV